MTELSNFNVTSKEYTGNTKKETLVRERLDNSVIRRDLRIHVDLHKLYVFDILKSIASISTSAVFI